MPITLIAKLKAKAGSEKATEEELKAMIPKVRQEQGTLTYILHRSAQDPTVFVFYEVYRDQAAFDAHGKTPHMAELFGKLRGLLEGPPALEMLTELDRK